MTALAFLGGVFLLLVPPGTPSSSSLSSSRRGRGRGQGLLLLATILLLASSSPPSAVAAADPVSVVSASASSCVDAGGDGHGGYCQDSSSDDSDHPPATTHSSPPAAVEAETESEATTRSLTSERDFPRGWERYTYIDIREYFGCNERSDDNYKPVPSLEDWQLMRDAYTKIVDPDETWDDPIPPTLGYSMNKRGGDDDGDSDGDGDDVGDDADAPPRPPPYYARSSPGKGRGLFASRDITRGELVHDGTHSDVVFPSARTWRRYVFALPPEFACDSTDWHWMQRLEEGGEYYLLAGLNISSLMNSGGVEYGPGRTPNAMPRDPYSGRFYATRDIGADEEILTDYDAYYTNWSDVGL